MCINGVKQPTKEYTFGYKVVESNGEGEWFSYKYCKGEHIASEGNRDINTQGFHVFTDLKTARDNLCFSNVRYDYYKIIKVHFDPKDVLYEGSTFNFESCLIVRKLTIKTMQGIK